MTLAWFDKLGIMGWPLALCSVIALAVILERLLFMLYHSARARETYQDLATTLKRHRNAPKPLRDDLTAVHLQSLQPTLQGGLKTLRTLGTISPLLGLLGTVLGIIQAFQQIAASSGPVHPSLIADGLWEALLTTAVGLSIALPCLLAAQGYKAWGDHLLHGFWLRLNHLSLSFDLDDAEITDAKAHQPLKHGEGQPA